MFPIILSVFKWICEIAKLFLELVIFSCTTWILNDTTVVHTNDNGSDAWADCASDTIERWARIRLFKKVNDCPPPHPTMHACAAHEVAHLFAADMEALAQSRFATPQAIESVNERMANVLERILTA